jgi:hypothetical protein
MQKNIDMLYKLVKRKIGIALIKINLGDTFGRNNGFASDNCGNVTGLNLSDQSLSDIEFLSELSSLECLDLSDNCISQIKCLKNLKNLKKLDLSDNSISDISFLGELKKLEWVNLRNNQIKKLPVDIMTWGMEVHWENDKEDGLILENNPLEEEFVKVVKEGRKAQEVYFGIKFKKNEYDRSGVNKAPKENIPVMNPITGSTEKKELISFPGVKRKNQKSVFEEKRDVFLSYASEDYENYVKPFAEELQKQNFTYWLDKEDVKCGDSIIDEMGKGIQSVHYFIAFISKNFKKDRMCAAELRLALKREFDRKPLKVIPILIGETDLLEMHPFLVEKHCIKWDNNIRGLVEKVMDQSQPSFTKKERYESADKANSYSEFSCKISSDILHWCLEKIFRDQYESGAERGAWSKEFPGFLNALYNETENENTVEGKDTLTYSTWIMSALSYYLHQCEESWMRREIREKINFFHKYLLEHYDSKNRGFGLATSINSMGERKIQYDIRHTCWALLALNQLNRNDLETANIILSACYRLAEEFETLNPTDNWPVTNSVLHRILSNEAIASRIIPSPESVRRRKKVLEAELIRTFNDTHHCWGWFNDRATKTSIDNALSVLYTLEYDSIIDEDLKNQVTTVANYLLSDELILLGGDKAALPFQKGGKPSLGVTIHLLYLVQKKLNVEIEPSLIRKIFNFINAPENRIKFNSYSFSWHLASICHLVV